MAISNNIINESITNPNALKSNKFRFMIKILPHVNFFVTAVSMPGISLGLANHPTPFTDLKLSGDKMQFDELTIQFQVDEDLKNWVEIYNWMKGISFPENFEQYKDWNNRVDGRWEKIYSDCTLHFLTNANIPNIEIDFIDCFPANLSGFDLNESSDTVVASLSLFYQYLIIK